MLSTKEVKIIIPGPAPGKPRMTRRDKWAKRDCVVRYRSWSDKVRHIAGKLPDAAQVADLSWVAEYEPPPSWSKKKRATAIGTLHRSKPDRDNVDKAILDCLYPGGDSAIARGTIQKLWGTKSKLTITITLEPDA